MKAARTNGKKKGSSSGPQCVRLSAVALVLSWAGLLFYVLRPASSDGPSGHSLMSSAKMDQLGLSNGKEITAFVGQFDSAAEYTFSKPLGAFDQGESGLPQPKDDPEENLDVQMQHTVLMERDGFAMELDEQTNLQVPMFWEPPAGSDQLDHVDMIDGQPTIFLMIASYRDWQCRDTATSALERTIPE